MTNQVESTELDKLHAAFEDVVQMRLMTIQTIAARAGQLPLEPIDKTPLMIAVNTEAHILYWKGVYFVEGGEKE